METVDSLLDKIDACSDGLLNSARFGAVELIRIRQHSAVFKACLLEHSAKEDLCLKVIWGKPDFVGSCIGSAKRLVKSKATGVLPLPEVYEVESREVNGLSLGYVISRWVPGLTLDELMRRDDKLLKGRNLRDVVFFLSSLARAVGALHNEPCGGLFHGDIKPSNIIVQESSGPHPRPVVALIDFDTMRCLDEGVVVSPSRFPTRGYAAPECFEGIVRSSADVYSFGVVAAELLSMVPSISIRHAKCHPCRRLVEIIEKSVSKNPDRRPSASQLEKELDRLTQDCLECACGISVQPRSLMGADTLRPNQVRWSQDASQKCCTTPLYPS